MIKKQTSFVLLTALVSFFYANLASSAVWYYAPTGKLETEIQFSDRDKLEVERLLSSDTEQADQLRKKFFRGLAIESTSRIVVAGAYLAGLGLLHIMPAEPNLLNSILIYLPFTLLVSKPIMTYTEYAWFPAHPEDTDWKKLFRKSTGFFDFCAKWLAENKKEDLRKLNRGEEILDYFSAK